jgi:DNA modification methylase
VKLDQSIAQVDIGTLKPYPGNPRQGDVEAIAHSLSKNGQYRPIVVRAETLEILAGNHTWKAAKHLGWPTIAVSFIHELTDDEAKRIVLADNRYSDLATYDPQALADLLTSLEDPDGTGYAASDIESLLASLTALEPPTALTDPDDVPELPEAPQSLLGDIWSLGPHRLLVGDATGDLTGLMGDELADLFLTDPPYNVAVQGGTKDKLTIQNDKLLDTDFRSLLEGAFGRASAVAKQGAPIYVFHADSERVAFQTSAENAGWSIRQNLIWVKNSLVMSRQDYHWKHEPILYGWLPGAAHTWYADRKQTTVIEWDRPSRNTEHPTMKPVGLIQYLITNSSQPGDIVLDTFGGSGSTLIACHAERRVARLVELDPKYADVILRRYMEHTGDTPTNQQGEKFGG